MRPPSYTARMLIGAPYVRQGLSALARIFGMATSPNLPGIAPSAPGDGDTAVLERTTQRTEPPRMHQVVLLNDDFTPMDFVVTVIQKFFGLDREQATRIMLKVHREGVGVCGVFPRDVAATKVEQVSTYARQHQHPLACVMEEN